MVWVWDLYLCMNTMQTINVGIEQDETKAIANFQKAAFHGHGGACNNLGYMYDHVSSIIAKDRNQARTYYKSGALKGTAVIIHA